jgi:hypothetical protein
MITCTSRIPLALSFTAGLAVCVALTMLLDLLPHREIAEPAPADLGQQLGAMPRCREHAAVLSWIFEHRPDATTLEFASWSPPRPVANNPFTNGPATLVKVVVKNRSTAEEKLEYLSFYLRDLDVLGSVSKPYPEAMVAVCA